jgi:hypothetical protein
MATIPRFAHALARNPDGSRAIDDNLIWNVSGKAIWQATTNQKIAGSYNYNWKERFHRRDTPPNFVEDKASLWQTNPAFSTQVRYTLVRNKIVFESTFGLMDGVTNYYYQPETADTDIRIVDNGLSTAANAAARHEEAPNYRSQFDNIVSYAMPGWGGDHVLKAGLHYAQMGMFQQFWVNQDQWIEFNNGAPNQVRLWNTPTAHNSTLASGHERASQPTPLRARSRSPRDSLPSGNTHTAWPARRVSSPRTSLPWRCIAPCPAPCKVSCNDGVWNTAPCSVSSSSWGWRP